MKQKQLGIVGCCPKKCPWVGGLPLRKISAKRPVEPAGSKQKKSYWRSKYNKNIY
jgi:hypothetical protein